MPAPQDQGTDARRELMIFARQLSETIGFSVVPEAHALIGLIEQASADPASILKTTTDPMDRLMFEKEVLHGLRTYLQSADTVHNQASLLIKTRKKRLNLSSDEITLALDKALADHNAEPLNAALYAIGNVFRHRVTPDTINFETRATMDGGVTTSFELVVGLGLRGLTSGQGWTNPAKAFVRDQHPVVIRSLVEGHMMSLSRLANEVVSTVRQENQHRGR